MKATRALESANYSNSNPTESSISISRPLHCGKKPGSIFTQYTRATGLARNKASPSPNFNQRNATNEYNLLCYISRAARIHAQLTKQIRLTAFVAKTQSKSSNSSLWLADSFSPFLWPLKGSRISRESRKLTFTEMGPAFSGDSDRKIEKSRDSEYFVRPSTPGGRVSPLNLAAKSS